MTKKLQAEEATKLFDIIPRHMGKKKIMGRQLPFDIFVQRKLDKWKQRAEDQNISVVDAVGVSPICEMIYFWNGYKRMQPAELQFCLARLDYSLSMGSKPWEAEAPDEKGIYSLLTGTILRHLGKIQDARTSLKPICDEDRTLFKGSLRDNWVAPSANYEMGVTYWLEYKASGSVKALEESLTWLDTVAAWETYDLDTR